VFQPKTKWQARIYELRELLADDTRVRGLLKALQAQHPQAFAALVALLDRDWDKRVAEGAAAIPSPVADLDEGTYEGDESSTS